MGHSDVHRGGIGSPDGAGAGRWFVTTHDWQPVRLGFTTCPSAQARHSPSRLTYCAGPQPSQRKVTGLAT